MTAAAACRTCGTELGANARFCHGCGSPVVESQTHAEYKQVTVLFADVVRSMDLAATLDMERWREIVTELVERSAAVGRQEEAKRLAVEFRFRDGVDLRVRVGLNSGQVIAGESGAGALGYGA